MGLFKFVKGQFLKVIEWQDNTKNTMVHKFNKGGYEIMFGSQLIVHESQVAVFTVKGKIADVFKPGKYTLASGNLPLITNLLSLPFGFKSAIITDVYFVNTKQFTNEKWGTSNPITLRDKDFGTIRIKSFGSFSFRVNDASLFLKELFGTNSNFTTGDITNYLKSMLVSTFADTVAESKISALDLAANLLEFSELVKKRINERFAGIGLVLANFVVENVSFPEEVEKAIDMNAKLGIMGDKMDTFMKYQAANAMTEAAKNSNGAGMFMGAGVGMGAGMGMNNMMQQAFASTNNQQNNAGKAFCHQCGAAVKAGAKFCPDCGSKLSAACPKCGAAVKANAKFCGECGQKL